MPIQVLPPEVANQIAAGEVVERPASVVKELIENCLDAGATDIRVEVREGGRRLIRVQDNGSGIRSSETDVLFHRHATSKITSAEDLDHLTTLGFRGEALASIGSVAQVSLLTRTADEELGTLVRIAGGIGLTREPRGTPVGTIVTVEHLFANVPARLKFLKQAATEASHILQIVTRYALIHPERRFSLTSDGRLTFQSNGSGKLYDVLVKVYGLEVAGQMLAVGEEAENGGVGEWENGREDPFSHSPTPPLSHSSPRPTIKVSGYTGVPSLHRSSRAYISLFVNGRWFQDGSLAYGVIQAYHTLLPVGRYPMALIFIEMDPADVDVNVHPTKAEVRFRDSQAVFGAVQRAVRRVLTERAPIPEVGLGNEAPVPAPQTTWEQLEAWSMRREALLGGGAGSRRELVQAPGEPGEEPGEAPGEGVDGDFRAAPDGTAPERALSTPVSPVPQKIPLLRVLGQLGGTYIVAEGPDGMYLIDQHAAHERILYEQMLADWMGRHTAVQQLLEPLVLHLSPEQAAALSGELERLGELGVEIEPFGGSSYLVRSVPAVLSRDSPESALTEIIDGLGERANVVDGTREGQLITLICKRAAIKGGHALSMAEMQTMVRQLEECRSPRTCPHGRPTMIHVSASELARQFGRI